jgi:hypothetical protein
VGIDHSASNEIEHLLEDDHIAAGWCSFVHTPYQVAGISTQHQPAFSLWVKPSCGTTVKPILHSAWSRIKSLVLCAKP